MTAIAPRWAVRGDADPAAVDLLVRSLNIPPTLAALLVHRGFADPDDARRFLRPSLDSLSDPAHLHDVDRAVDLITGAVRHGHRILVHGDYDVDGQCATTLLTRVLREAGGDVVPFVPHRVRDGYDFGPAGLEKARTSGASLVVTCDCGTTASETVTAAQAAGIQVVVTDHHLPSVFAPADAMVNPQHPDCPAGLEMLCGTGVAFKLAQALVRELELPDNLPLHLLDLVALATVADVVPLVGENRILVRHGLKVLAASRWPGVRALVEVAGFKGKEIRAGHVGFILAPRLNAAGRIGDAMDGVRLLLSDDPVEARKVAVALETTNSRRQAMDEEMLGTAVELVEKTVDLDETFGLVVAQDGWHAGVIGLVASRLVERYSRPTIVISVEAQEGKGSGRSISGFDLHDALTECAPLLTRYGGHRMAAGLSIDRDRIDEFRETFNRVARERLMPEDLVPTQRIDVVVPVEQMNDELERLFRHLEPCGAGNPAPVLGIAGGAVRNHRVVGANHLRFSLADRTGAINAIAFNWADRLPDDWWRQPLDVAVKLDRNEFRGESTLQARVVQIQPAR
jgi:single-stranded-DNA-specific exonuclease